MTTGTILAATPWPTNADLIAACAHLRYLNPGDLILDPTYGRGVWWRAWVPTDGHLVTNDIDPSLPSDVHADFTALPFPDDTFDAATFDPPYAAMGSAITTTLPDYHARYGRTHLSTPTGVQDVINAGLDEMARVVRPGGIILTKCQAYVWSGRLWEGDAHTRNHAVDKAGLDVVDRLEHIGRARPQPARTRADGIPSRQHHARRNLSTLFVFRRPKGARR